MGRERRLVEEVKHRAGKYGGFTFGGQQPDGVSVHHPLRRGSRCPDSIELEERSEEYRHHLPRIGSEE
jgi:hypothetical protein